MPRVKRGTLHAKRRRYLKKQTKGYMWGRKSKMKLMKTAIVKAGAYAYRDRRRKKRDMRGLAIIRINAGAREHGTTYAKLISALKKKNITIDRKILSTLAKDHPNVFKKIVEQI